jgi:hypothetical protein
LQERVMELAQLTLYFFAQARNLSTPWGARSSPNRNYISLRVSPRCRSVEFSV